MHKEMGADKYCTRNTIEMGEDPNAWLKGRESATNRTNYIYIYIVAIENGSKRKLNQSLNQPSMWHKGHTKRDEMCETTAKQVYFTKVNAKK